MIVRPTRLPAPLSSVKRYQWVGDSVCESRDLELLVFSKLLMSLHDQFLCVFLVNGRLEDILTYKTWLKVPIMPAGVGSY